MLSKNLLKINELTLYLMIIIMFTPNNFSFELIPKSKQLFKSWGSISISVKKSHVSFGQCDRDQ